MLICSLAAAAMLPASAAEKPANYVLQEGFENVKMNNKGILYCPYIYPTTKLTEGREYSYIRGKREVGEGKFSLKMVNLQEKGAFFLMCDKVIPNCQKGEYFVLSAKVRGKGYVQLALVNYTGKNKFIGTAGGSLLKDKPGITLKKPLDSEEWTTIYFKCPRAAKSTDDGICKMAIFIYPKSEVYIDDIKVWAEKTGAAPAKSK
jgi:hypothetical protein